MALDEQTGLTTGNRGRRQRAIRRVGKLGLGFKLVLVAGALGLPWGLIYLMDGASWTFPVGLGGFFALSVACLAAIAVVARRARRAHLDAELGALGLCAQADEMMRALYAGRWRDRDLSVCHVSPRGRYSPALLLIRFGTRLRGRLMIRARPVPIARTPGVTELPAQPHPLDNVRVWSSQPPWASKLLGFRDARRAVSALMTEGSDHQLDLRPDGLLLKIRHPDLAGITGEVVKGWLAPMDTLLTAAEELARTTPLERLDLCFAEHWEADNLSPAGSHRSGAWMAASVVFALVVLVAVAVAIFR